MTSGGSDAGPRSGPPRPLPRRTPEADRDDPDATERIRRIVAHPSYRLAEADPDFIVDAQLRGVRLELDYMKAELGLAARGITHTIVVFGSTRIPEPRAARRALTAARAASDADPSNAALATECAIAERIADNSRYYDVARAFARRVSAAGDGADGRRVAIVTGGGPGLMEAANRGAFDQRANTVGLNISLPHEQYPNPYLTEGLCFQFRYFAMRKLHFLQRACALVAFPGGYGTFDEVFETLVLVQTGKIAPLPVVLVGRAFWSRAVDFDFLAQEGVIAASDLDLFRLVETADEAFDQIAPIFG